MCGTSQAGQSRRSHVDDEKAWSVPVRAGLAAQAHRTTGHAAEMAFFAVLTLVPSTVAVGSALGLTEKLIGSGVVTKAEDASVEAVRTLMGPRAGRQGDLAVHPRAARAAARRRRDRRPAARLVALEPSVHGDLDALDHAYGVKYRRATMVQRFIALAFALVSVAIVAASVELMVSGPLGDPEGGLRAGSG